MNPSGLGAHQSQGQHQVDSVRFPSLRARDRADHVKFHLSNTAHCVPRRELQVARVATHLFATTGPQLRQDVHAYVDGPVRKESRRCVEA